MLCPVSTSVFLHLAFNKTARIFIKNINSYHFSLCMPACLPSCFSCVWLLVAPWTIAHQAPLSMEFSRQEHWSGLPFSSPGNLRHLRTELESPTLQADSLPLSHQGSLASPYTDWNPKSLLSLMPYFLGAPLTLKTILQSFSYSCMSLHVRHKLHFVPDYI